ncbi:hypothetical protein J8I29_15115 [Labrys sp. LIt4]|uniref:hypothetical protein n=1 Tax=unclassified Labrys (in: a-proteobacteria) TaxID=2688601 RepID=UPI00082ABA9E|nr:MULTISPECIES: hypothetical protein [unclassified Labrys (in: a-proteobacteria)]MBP0580654.1 hypothetical protein [Labrys sp. LIt4]OCC03958.1 hypothetical protein BA190_15815 [Labrys sp. WJW]
MAWTQPIQHEQWQPAGQGGLRHVADGLPAGDPDRGAVLLLGNFDGFHRGHQALLDAAERIAGGDLPLAVMSCEPHPRSFFCTSDSPFRLTTSATKARRFAALGFDYVFSPTFDAGFASLTPAEFAHGLLKQALGISHVVTGDDFRFGRSRAGDADLLAHLGRSLGFGVTCVPEVSANARRCSSSQVRAFLRAGDIRAANALLGSAWMAETVASGGQLALSPMLCRPPAGRYLCWTDGGTRHFHLGADGVITTDRGTTPAPGFLRFLDRLA